MLFKKKNKNDIVTPNDDFVPLNLNADSFKNFKDVNSNKIEIRDENGKITTFCPTVTIRNFQMDENAKLWQSLSLSKYVFFEYSNIVSVELYQNNSSVYDAGTETAIAGAMLFGLVGAVIGQAAGSRQHTSIDTLMIQVTTNLPRYPLVTIDLLDQFSYGIQTGGVEHKKVIEDAAKIMALLNNMKNQAQVQTQQEQPQALPYESNPSSETTLSSADEIKKFFDLFQAGIITEEEFQKKKAELLGL